MMLASLLSSSRYIIANKDLIKMLGLNEAIILGELCSEYTYWENRNELNDENWFYSTRENIEENTGINSHFQRIAISNLANKGLISLKRMGVPCKIYYKINEESIIKWLQMAKLPVMHEMNDKESTSSMSSNSSDEYQDVHLVNGNNNNINNKKNNNKEHTPNAPPIELKKEYAKLVTLTENEYQELLKTYGDEKVKKLLEELSLYKQAYGKKYDSDYAAIKFWVIKRVEEQENADKQNKSKQTSNKTKFTFEQREYPPDFFDQFYAN